MESLKLNNLLRKHCSTNKIALICVSHNEMFKEITFQQVFDIANEIKSFMLRNIDVTNICVGLLMDKNDLLPSIIISFQDLCYSFVFLTTNTLLDSISRLNTKWVLSVDIKPFAKNFSIKETLHISGTDELYLWENDNFVDNDKPLSTKDVFCVVQTSGSTGEKKTVHVPHTCIETNVISLNKYFGISSNDVIYWGTPLTFDPTLVEFILGISNEATLIIVPKLVAINPSLLYQALFKKNSTTFLQVVPSIFLRWSKQQIYKILLNSSLQTLAFGGEPFPQEILHYRRKQDLKLFNLYGITELSCWATIADLTAHSAENEVSLGIPLDETFVHVKDERENLVLNGVEEIWIGSNTRYCVINNDLKKPYSQFLVRTGDLGEWKNGNLFYRGRKTRVIKRFGHRVILHKMESVIFNETGLQNRLVYSVLHKKLLAFIQLEEHHNKHTKVRLLDKLRVKLLKILPEHAFPDFVDVLTHFPLNAHGKMCDKSLVKLYQESLNESFTKEQNIGDIFVNILSKFLRTELRDNIEHLGKHTFVELGGNSILVLQFLQTFEEHIGNKAPEELVSLLLNDSIQACLNYVIENVTFKRKMSEDVTGAKEAKILKVEMTPLQSSVIWKYNLKGCVDSAPIAFNKSGKTYAAAGSFAQLFAIICEDGEEHLRLNLPEEVETQPCASKCGNFIFVGCANGSIYCIDLECKKIAWEHKTLQKVRSSACICGTAIVVGSYDGFVYCLAAKNGALQWKTELVGSVRADSVCEENVKRIYVGTTKGMCYSLNEGDGSIVWTYKVDGPVFGSPCVVRECTIWTSVNGELYCFSSAGDVKWTLKADGNIFSSLTVQKNVAYFGSHDSYLYRLAVPSDAEPKLTKLIKMESESSSSPFLYRYGGKVFVICVCNIGVLYVIDALTETVVFQMQLPAKSFSSPYVFNNRVYVGCRDDNLYCINIERALIH